MPWERHDNALGLVRLHQNTWALNDSFAAFEHTTVHRCAQH